MTRKEAVEAVKAKAAPKGKKVKTPVSEAQAAAKKAGDKALMDTAANMPHGSGKRFLELTKELDQIEGQAELLNKRKRGVRASLKEMKVELRPYDHVRKLRKMEPEDMRGFEASTALYKDQLGMTLSGHEKVIKQKLDDQREAARDAMIDASGGETGKEVGSSTQPGSTNGAKDETVTPAVPTKNDNFRPVSAAAH